MSRVVFRNPFCLSGSLLLLISFSAQAFPVISNPSFEDPFTPDAATGWAGAISGWDTELGRQGNGACGAAGVAWQGSTAALYDNGIPTDGSNVGFLYQGRTNAAPQTDPYLAPVRIYQSIPGFRKGRHYRVHYSQNARALFSSTIPLPVVSVLSEAFCTVKLNGVVIDADHGVNPLEGNGSYTVPFTERTSDEFVAPDDGAYVLEFIAHNNVYFDSTLLLDNIRITQFPPDTNTPPILEPLDPHSTYPGMLLRFLVPASDTNDPPQKLTYALGANAPEGAFIDSNTGEFSWEPVTAQVGHHEIPVTVTDDGDGTLSSAGKIVVDVIATPALQLLTDGGTRVSWTALENSMWQVEVTEFLPAAIWNPVGSPVISTGVEPSVVSDPDASRSSPRFYRLRLVPQ